MWVKNKLIKKLINIVYFLVIIGCFAYGIASVTYASTHFGRNPDVNIIINNSGSHATEGDLFSEELFYPGKEKQGIIRITNNYIKANVHDLGVNVALNSFKEMYSEDVVYDSFLDHMKLTIKKGRLLAFDKVIVDNKSIGELLSDGIPLKDLGNINLGNSMDLEYTLKMDEAAGNELQLLSADIDFIINASGDHSDDDDDDDDDDESPPDGDLIDRMPDYIELAKASKINKMLEEFTFDYNGALIEGKDDYDPRVYYWNNPVEKWIALTSYSNVFDEIKAVNDGEYNGWFKVFGVIQPKFTDIENHWAESTVNRMNGLGIIEGYPGDGLVRPAKLDEQVTRAEFAMLLYRLLNINPDQTMLDNYSLVEAQQLLPEHFQDAEIPDWIACQLTSMVKANLIDTREGNFEPNASITRLEAAVMTSKAMQLLTRYKPLDLSKFEDAEDIPDWAKAVLAENVIEGYPDNFFRPDNFITRAEALTVLKRLFVNGMGL